MIEKVVKDYPFPSRKRPPLRKAKTATCRTIGARCATTTGNSFRPRIARISRFSIALAAVIRLLRDLIYGFLTDHDGTQWAVECGAAHGALAMTTPGGYFHGDT